MPDELANVDGDPLLHPVHELAAGRPTDAEIRTRAANDLFHRPAADICDRREGQAAVAHHLGRDSLIDAAGRLAIDQDGLIAVGVAVHKTRGHDLAIGVNRRARLRAGEIPYLHDAVGDDSDIARKPGVAAAIHDAATANKNI